MYDANSAKTSFDFFSARAYARAEDTFRDVVLGVLNDFLEGDLETVRVLLRAYLLRLLCRLGLDFEPQAQ